MADLLGISMAQVRWFARSGAVSAGRGPRGEIRFSFQDLAALRSALKTLSERISPRKVRRVLKAVRQRLGPNEPLSAVRLEVASGRVLVRDRVIWDPSSGQTFFDFKGEPLGELAPLIPEKSEYEPDKEDAEEWYVRGCELEQGVPPRLSELPGVEDACAAYRRALAAEPTHAGAHINLGRLLHIEGELVQAERHYRAALAACPERALAFFNLGVVLEDLERIDEAIEAYEHALAIDQGVADVHYNLARLHERKGQKAEALRYFKSFRQLTRD